MKMASMRFYESTDMSQYDWNFILPTAPEKMLPSVMWDGSSELKVVYRGSFQYELIGDDTEMLGVSGGTLTGFELYENQVIRALMSGISYDAVSALIYMEMSGQNKDLGLELFQEMLTGADTIRGSYFDDKLFGFAGDDTMFGGRSNDTLFGGNGNDVLFGENGADVLDGGTGSDQMTGGDGNDQYYIDDVNDVVTEANLAGGIDTVLVTGRDYALGANVENATMQSGGTFKITGNGLNNVIIAGAGDNILDGGIGNDTVSYQPSGYGVTVDIATTIAQNTSGSGTDTLSGFENLIGSKYRDTLFGNSAANLIEGGAGKDVINARTGDDTLIGGLGQDVLTGGAGKDIFVFNSQIGEKTFDTIRDFTAVDDIFYLKSSVFGEVAVGKLGETAFITGTAATDEDHRIIYNSASGALYYDEDGSGEIAAVQIAMLDFAPQGITAADFFII